MAENETREEIGGGQKTKATSKVMAFLPSPTAIMH
jgi:hypothetical protein